MKLANACMMGLWAGVSLAADIRWDVSELVTNVTNDLAVDCHDRRMAESIESIHLTERLTAETVEMLVKTGVGPATARALEALRKRSAGLAAPAQDAISQAPALSDSAQLAILQRVRGYAGEYVARFPDFIATRSVRQYRNWGADYAIFGDAVVYHGQTPAYAWHEILAYKAEVAHTVGRDYYRKAGAGKGRHDHASQVSIGEFGGMLEEIFNPRHKAHFHWDRWQVLDGKKTVVFAYQVAREFSEFTVAAEQGGKLRHEPVKTGHQGFVFADPESGEVLRLVLSATGLTPGDRVDAAGDVLDYGKVRIGGQAYWLPVRSIAYVSSKPFKSREEIEYSNYRKFDANTTIDFNGPLGP